jgi:hypothetical protein
MVSPAVVQHTSNGRRRAAHEHYRFMKPAYWLSQETDTKSQPQTQLTHAVLGMQVKGGGVRKEFKC